MKRTHTKGTFELLHFGLWLSLVRRLFFSSDASCSAFAWSSDLGSRAWGVGLRRLGHGNKLQRAIDMPPAKRMLGSNCQNRPSDLLGPSLGRWVFPPNQQEMPKAAIPARSAELKEK